MDSSQPKRYITALTIAGSDNRGGAGIQADLKTFSALGCYGMSVITAVTAQNTVGVREIHPIPAPMVVQQLECVLEEIETDAIKTGMLVSQEIIDAVADTLFRYPGKPLVIDPVMVSSSGYRLLEKKAEQALVKRLFPLASLITPNRVEAEVLLNRSLKEPQAMEQACHDLLHLGAKAVLFKGGHFSGDTSEDCLGYYESGGDLVLGWYSTPRIHTKNTHGTGCSLASAIAAYLAKGKGLAEAVLEAKRFLTSALEAGASYQLGKGPGPLHHFYQFWGN